MAFITAKWQPWSLLAEIWEMLYFYKSILDITVWWPQWWWHTAASFLEEGEKWGWQTGCPGTQRLSMNFEKLFLAASIHFHRSANLFGFVQTLWINFAGSLVRLCFHGFVQWCCTCSWYWYDMISISFATTLFTEKKCGCSRMYSWTFVVIKVWYQTLLFLKILLVLYKLPDSNCQTSTSMHLHCWMQ